MKKYQKPQISVWELTEKDVFLTLSVNTTNGGDGGNVGEAFTDDSQGSFGSLFGQ